MRKHPAWLVAMTLVLSLFPGGAPRAHAAPGDPIYVSLGDSLSVGYQPGRGRTDLGYVDDLWQRARATIAEAPATEVRMPW